MIGKFGQRPHLAGVAFVSDNNELDAMFSNHELDIQNCFEINDDIMEVHFQHSEKYIKDSKSTHAIINSLITAKARILLHSSISEARSRGCILYYCDTVR